MGLSSKLSCEGGSFSCCHLNPPPPRGLRLYFPALDAGALGCAVCLAPPPVLPVYLCANVVPWGLPAAAWPSPVHNLTPRWVRQLLPCHKSSPPPLPVSTPPTGLDERFFFISLVVRLPYSLIFCQFWLFFVLNCRCPSFGCARRHSVSTNASILAGAPFSRKFHKVEPEFWSPRRMSCLCPSCTGQGRAGRLSSGTVRPRPAAWVAHLCTSVFPSG